MFLGLVTLPIVALMSIGGWGEMMTALSSIDPYLTTWSGPGGWSGLRVLVIGLSMIGLGFLGSPQIFVRFLSLKSEKEVAPGAAM